MDDLTDVQLELLAAAYAMYVRSGGGLVIEDVAYPDADDLAQRGWLARRFQPDGEMSWHWTPAAETALDVNALQESVRDRHN